MALGEKIIGLVLLFFVEPFVAVWTALSFSNYIKTRDELFSSTWLNKLNEHFSDLTYEADNCISDSCISHNRCYGNQYLSGYFRGNHFEFSNIDLSINHPSRNSLDSKMFHGFCIIWTLNKGYDEQSLEAIEVKIADAIENSIPDYLDDGRLIVHVPGRFVLTNPQNSQKTEEEIALVVKVMSTIEQITAHPEFASPTKITVPHQKSMLTYEKVNNFFCADHRKGL